MNTTATASTSFSSTEPSWSRRGSTETIFSIQGHETDFVRDTTDTEGCASDDSGDDRPDTEYEPVTDEDDAATAVVSGDSSGPSDNEIISTKVVEVSVGEDGEVSFADAEQTDTEGSDSEMDLHDYWRCAKCHTTNNNPLYRYCEKCFQERKNFFPPRPKRKRKRVTETIPLTLSQDSGVGSQYSQSISGASTQSSDRLDGISDELQLKRRAESADRNSKRQKVDCTDSESDTVTIPLVKTISDPSITIEETVKVTKKVISKSLKEKIDDNMCIVCFSEPKSGVFVHGRVAHICCCYECAVKVWKKAKRCPICNRKVSNILKAVVM